MQKAPAMALCSGVGGWREVAHLRVTTNERSVSWSDPELSHASWWPFREQCLSGSHCG